jgi:hypothetical protein
VGTGPDRRSCVVLAHRYVGMQQALADSLIAARPGIELVSVRSDALDATLGKLAPECDPVVVCADPTTLMQERAHGWVVEVVDGPETALLVGAGDGYRVVARHSFEQLVAAILERLDAPPSPPWRREHIGEIADPAVDTLA